MRILPVEINCLSIQDVADKNDDTFLFLQINNCWCIYVFTFQRKLHWHDSQVSFFSEAIATGYMKFQLFASIPSWIEICPIRVFNVKQHFVGGNKPLNHETIIVDQAA